MSNVDAGTTPTVTVLRNGTDDSSNWALATITNPDTGRYYVTGTVYASASAGDLIEVEASWQINGITVTCQIDEFRLTQWGVDALPSAASGAAGAVLTSGTGTAQLSVSGGVANANVKKVNDVTVTGTGASGDEWGP